MISISLTELRRLHGQLDAAVRVLNGGTTNAPWSCTCNCRSRLDHAHRVADQASGHLRSAGGSGRRTKGSHPDPTAATAMRPDEAASWLPELATHADRASRAVADLVATVAKLSTITTENPREFGGTGPCIVCESFCTGIGEDHLRRGYCNACRMAYRRADYPPANEFLRERRKWLAQPDGEVTWLDWFARSKGESRSRGNREAV